IFANKPDLTPTKILKQMETALRKKLGDTIGVHSGNLAVTIKYKDGPEIQIIPCIKTNNGIRIPNFENNTWSSADPSKFANTLTKSNEKCNGKLIPTIKLAKAINATLPEKLQLTGYHIETLAVTAFQGYTETKTTSSMLPHFFKKASELVLKPITDKTGQSTHVDEYLGKANSTERKMVSHTLDRLYRRMFNASAANSKDRWKELFGE
ncbi:MAG: hypothetical protein LBV04_05540, partial [Deferribacteraceae bacterium]|nr:hypothetical protein [Deferribacteraceae bacterium]